MPMTDDPRYPHPDHPRGKSMCPHADIRFCPLYVATHDTRGLGCLDGREDEGGCAVHRGLGYADAVAKLDSREVAELRWREQAEAMKAQRARNMRAAGLH